MSSKSVVSSTYKGVIKQSHDHNCMYHCAFVHEDVNESQLLNTSYASAITGEREVIVVSVSQLGSRHDDQDVVIVFSNQNQWYLTCVNHTSSHQYAI